MQELDVRLMLHEVLCSLGIGLRCVPSSYTENTLGLFLDRNILPADVLVWQDGVVHASQSGRRF